MAERLGDRLRVGAEDTARHHLCTQHGLRLKTGREAKKPGFDPLFQSMSGLTAWNGGRSGGPIFLRTAICDDTNALMLAVAVLMALNHRDRTGQGQKVDLSLMKNGVHWQPLTISCGTKARKRDRWRMRGCTGCRRCTGCMRRRTGGCSSGACRRRSGRRLKDALREEWVEPPLTFRRSVEDGSLGRAAL